MNIKYICRFLCRVLLIAFCLLCSRLHAQVNATAYFNKGGELFKEGKYFEASQCYEIYLANEKKARPQLVPFAVQKKKKGRTAVTVHQEAVYYLAESYRRCNDFEKAEKWYQAASNFPETVFPECRYWLAVTLRANRKFEEATAAISEYLAAAKGNSSYLTAANRELDNLAFIQKQLKKTVRDQFSVTPFDSTSLSSAYALTAAGSNNLVFTGIKTDSTAEKNGKKKYQYNNQLYTIANDENLLQKASIIALPENGMQHGLASFSKDGKKMFFTQWIKKSGKNISAVYICRQTDTGWSAPYKMEGLINEEGYNSTQPFVSADSRYLFFASDRPGGMGNYDLWYATLDSNCQALSVNNLGNIINTAGDEEAPFYNGQTLVFSSNGRVGMGGFDIYYSEGRYNLSGWQVPVNPGMPLNSVKDDIYFTSADADNLWNTGWVSSDRASECCLAIFSVKQYSRQLINGMVTDCTTQLPLNNVKLTVTDTRNKIMKVISTDEKGRYQMETSNVTGYSIFAELPEYASKTTSFSVKARYGADTINNEAICMASLKDSAAKLLRATFKSLNKNGLLGNFTFAQSVLDYNAHGELDSVIEVMTANPQIKIKVLGYTDGRGSEAFNLRLSKKRVDACIAYMVEKGIDKNRLEGVARGECCPVMPEMINGKDNPDARKKNRRVEYELVNEE